MRLKTFIRISPIFYPARLVGNMLFRKKQCYADIDRILKEPISEKEKRTLAGDMIKEKAKRFFTFEEYLLFGFRNKTAAERKEYISDYERVHYNRTFNSGCDENLFNNKYRTYLKYKEYFKRRAEMITDGRKKEYGDFTSSVGRFIAKPIASSFGNGVRIFDVAPSFEDFISTYKGGAIIEELIIQSEETKKLHPSSVNSVRITTVKLGDKTEIISPFIRVGRWDNVVDNGGAGGIICGINPETGVVFATEDEDGNRFDTHPETGEGLVGFQIPHWEDAVALSKELAEVTPENRYTGWDLVITDDGWVLMEANCLGQYYFQMLHGGCRKKIEGFMKELGLKPKFN